MIIFFLATVAGLLFFLSAVHARACADLRSLCYTNRADKSDCAMPYQQRQKTGVFITPLGRKFKATFR